MRVYFTNQFLLDPMTEGGGKFLDENFLLQNKTAQRLYHDHAAALPIIDYHNHLPPSQLIPGFQFENITQAWLNGDHYKWRAMRTQGVDEKFITGDASDQEKFAQWADTVPYTLRNPLYHWTHLELRRYFDINKVLNPSTAASIYQQCNEQLQQKEMGPRGMLGKMKVKLICTTDDPVDTLEYHRIIRESGWGIKVLPAFRPDRAMKIENVAEYNQYLDALEAASGTSISNYPDFLTALKKRHDFFATMGASVSDHGLEQLYAEDYTEKEIISIFSKIRKGQSPDLLEIKKFKSALLVELAEWDWEKGWVQQFHLGALRNVNERKMNLLGPDTGWDSIGDFSQARALATFLNRLDKNNKLTKTILYNLNPADNEMMATMAGNFNDGSVAGKIQWGSAWWFLDQKEGMISQLNTLSNMGLISRFIGMLTDSRSYLSFPRHEYFRRILCNLFGTEMENGELPDDMEWVSSIIRDICYNNAKDYFNWNDLLASDTPTK